MNMHGPQNVAAETELRHLAAVPYQMISPSNNAPIIGIFQDNLLGSFRFTREKLRFNTRDAMNLLMMYNRVDPQKLFASLTDKNSTVSNFEILSQIMPPISLYYKTKLFDEEPGQQKETSNHVLEIRNGQYIRGQIEKGVLGSGTKGILHRTCNDIGNMACADFIDNLQNIITEYMKSSSFSVGIGDLIADVNTQAKIIDVITEQKREVQTLIDRVHLGIFENNTASTNMVEFEKQVNSILNRAAEQSGKIGRNNLDQNNRFVTIVKCGSKGSTLNISQMISCLGQQNVDGKRIPYGFDNRTLPHFTKYDDSPDARGFIENSYIHGLTAPQLFFHAMGGRIGLIDTACKSVTWETPIFIFENGHPKYIPIGQWIDNKLFHVSPEKIQHFTEKNMEYLEIDTQVYIPTTDERGNVSWGELTAVTRHDPSEHLYEIKTQSGRTVTVAESRSLLIWDAQKEEFVETDSPKAKIGDFVPVTMELCEPPVTKTAIELSEFVYEEIESTSAQMFGNFELDEENGIFIGLFLAIGEMHEVDNYVYLDCYVDSRHCKYIHSFVKMWFIKNCIPFREDDTIIYGYSKVLCQFINKFVLNKNIPEFVFVSPEKFVVGFLEGYYSASSYVSNSFIKIFYTNNETTEGIAMLCSRIGIFGNIERISHNYSVFSIGGKWIQNFIEKLVLLNPYNQSRLMSISFDETIETNKNNVILDKIVEINVISSENHRKLYDVTVPSTLNFCIANGLHCRDTSQTGYIQRRLIKGLEDLKVEYDMTVRNSKGKIVQFAYGDDGIETTRIESQVLPLGGMSIGDIYAIYDMETDEESTKLIYTKTAATRFANQIAELKKKCIEYIEKSMQWRDDIISRVFNYKSDNSVKAPVAFPFIISNVQGQMHLGANTLVDITPLEAFQLIESNFRLLQKIKYAKPSKLFEILYYYYLNPRDLVMMKRFHRKAIVMLLEQINLNYKRSLIQPGEMVGVIAGQSIGEPTTQMTLNSVTYETEILVRDSKQNIYKYQIGDFVAQHIKSSQKIEYYEEKDTTYAELNQETEYFEIPSANESGETVWNRVEAVTQHPVVNRDGTNTMLKITTENCREVTVTKAKSVLKLMDGKIGEADGETLKLGDYLVVSRRPLEYNESAIFDFEGQTINLDYDFGYLVGSQENNNTILPKIVFSNKECIYGFLDACFDKDGTMNEITGEISLPVLSLQIAFDIQLMARNIGIVGFVNKYNNVYRLQFYENQAKKLAQILNLKIDHKQERVLQIRQKEFKYEISQTHDNIFPNEIAGEIVWEDRNGRMMDLLFEKITSIEEVPNTTNYAYDLTVENTRNFDIYNGLCLVDTFHFSGVASKSNVTRGVPRIEEILRLTKNPKNPSMNVFLRPEDELDMEKATKYTHILEHTKLGDVVKSIQLCFDPNDHESVIEEDKQWLKQFYNFEEMIGQCGGQQYGEAQPKSKWIIRMEMDAEAMLDKNISMDDIHYVITSYTSGVECVYTDYNADNLVFRVRILTSMLSKQKKKSASSVSPLDQTDELFWLNNFQESVLNEIVLRGISGITKVMPFKLQGYASWEEDKYVVKDRWVLDTTGSNLLETLSLDFIDSTRTFSNDIKEIHNVLGIEATRQIIYNELVEVIEFSGAYVNSHHLQLLADRMTITKNLVPIFRSGILYDDIGPIAKATFEVHTEEFLNAARHGCLDHMRGISANVMTGQNGYYGTSAFQVVLDIDKLAEAPSPSAVTAAQGNTALDRMIADFERLDIYGKCSRENIAIKNNIKNIVTIDLGKTSECEGGDYIGF